MEEVRLRVLREKGRKSPSETGSESGTVGRHRPLATGREEATRGPLEQSGGSESTFVVEVEETAPTLATIP